LVECEIMVKNRNIGQKLIFLTITITRAEKLTPSRYRVHKLMVLNKKRRQCEYIFWGYFEILEKTSETSEGIIIAINQTKNKQTTKVEKSSFNFL